MSNADQEPLVNPILGVYTLDYVNILRRAAQQTGLLVEVIIDSGGYDTALNICVGPDEQYICISPIQTDDPDPYKFFWKVVEDLMLI